MGILPKHNLLGGRKMKDKIKKIDINETRRYGKLVKIFKYTDSKYKYKVRIAPRTYIYLENF